MNNPKKKEKDENCKHAKIASRKKEKKEK